MGENPKIATYTDMLHVRVCKHVCPSLDYSFQHVLFSLHGQKVLEPVGEIWRPKMHAHAHTQARVLTLVCVCESELSVLLSHTIHHELLILLDHCRAFRTPRYSLKTQSEANAPNPPNTHVHAHKLSLSISYTHTHRDPEGTAEVLGDLASPTL